MAVPVSAEEELAILESGKVACVNLQRFASVCVRVCVRERERA